MGALRHRQHGSAHQRGWLESWTFFLASPDPAALDTSLPDDHGLRMNDPGKVLSTLGWRGGASAHRRHIARGS